VREDHLNPRVQYRGRKKSEEETKLREERHSGWPQDRRHFIEGRKVVFLAFS